MAIFNSYLYVKLPGATPKHPYPQEMLRVTLDVSAASKGARHMAASSSFQLKDGSQATLGSQTHMLYGII